MIPRRIRAAAAATAAAGAALALYALLIEPRWLQLRRSRIHIAGLPPDLDGLRIGVLSDPHLRDHRSAALLRRAVGALVEARPHLVAVTGDLAENRDGLEEAIDALATLDPPLGIFAVPGNHDHRLGIRSWQEAVRRHPGLVDLTNRYVLLRHGDTTLCVGGVDDLATGAPVLFLPPPTSRDVTVVLAHSPDQAERSRRRHDAIDLMISGHTHGGQVRLPLIGAPISSADRPDLYQQGLRRRPWTQVYISRGLGTTRIPVRFLARPEVSVLELSGAPRPPAGYARALRAYCHSHFRRQNSTLPAPRRRYENP